MVFRTNKSASVMSRKVSRELLKELIYACSCLLFECLCSYSLRCSAPALRISFRPKHRDNSTQVVASTTRQELIVNASITVADTSRGISRLTTSDAAGNYQLLLLPPGTYTVTVVSVGFAKFIVFTVGDQGTLPLQLSISDSENITVYSGANLIETQGSSQSTTVNQLRINNLPTNGRNYINFALTTSQIARDAAPPIGATPTSGPNFGGSRSVQCHQCRWC